MNKSESNCRNGRLRRCEETSLNRELIFALAISIASWLVILTAIWALI